MVDFFKAFFAVFAYRPAFTLDTCFGLVFGGVFMLFFPLALLLQLVFGFKRRSKV